MSNYGPFTILTMFSKVLEKVMHNRLSHYLQTNNILVQEHSCFRKGISTENAAFKLTDSVLKSVTNRCMLLEYSMIWQKLLTVNHEILLTK
jgi:predicted CoA-binding protein